MNLFDATLVVHVMCGTAGLVLGPVAMTARKLPGLHTRVGEVYHWVMLALCISAAAMAALEWERLWWFLPIAIGSYAFTLLGYVTAKLRFNNWLRFHLAGQGGSYIAMVTALLVVNLDVLPSRDQGKAGNAGGVITNEDYAAKVMAGEG